jgi:ammonium transporter, Amt family
VLKKVIIIAAIALLVFGDFSTGNALAQTVTAADLKKVADAAAAAQSAGDTAFMLVSSALVLLMTPGLAFFYGGFVRSRNVLNTLMMSFVLMGIVGVTWILWGYSLAFSPGNAIIGGIQWAFGNIGLDVSGYLPHMGYEDALKAANPKYADLASYAGTIPHPAFMIYQAMFAIITPALISGAIAERMSFTAYSLFVLLWSTFIYSPLAHMVWAKGGLLGLYGGLGALDFAGGTVVHISSGVSALVAAIVLGPRKTYPERLSPPHNVPFILLGAGLLWFGWFGFNAGSALAANSVATVAFVTTNTAAASGVLMWLILEKVLRGKPTAVGAATGGVAGLVGITPAAGFVTPVAAILIGAITAFVCFYAVSFKHKVNIDDALDTYPVHGVGGTVGAILTGIFATTTVNAGGADGLLYKHPQQLLTQIIAIAIAYVVSGVGTWLILKIIDATIGLRVKEEVEFQGIDINEHGEEAYNDEFGDRVSVTSK